MTEERTQDASPGEDGGDRDSRAGDRPRGVYERYLRDAFLYGLVLLATGPALALGLPILLVNALAHGGLRRAFFVQERVGHGGKIFRIVKFRTMRGTASDGPDRLRVTRFGRWLRNTHLDELPQVWNLLRRDMVLIGPRPEMIEIHEWALERIPRYAKRLEQRPGLTGLAQITQGYAASGDEVAYTRKAGLDAAYVRSIGWRGDLAILARTVVWVLRGRGWVGSHRTHARPSLELTDDRRAAA